jgi:Peptidase MA superfamily
VTATRGQARRGLRGARPRVAMATLVALLAAQVAILAATPAAVRAAGTVSFGQPTITATFLSGIDLSEPVTLPPDVRRIDAVVHTEGSERAFVTPVSLPGPGGPVLRFQFATPSGGLLPNTLVQMGFRVTLMDGSVVDGPIASVHYDDTRYAWQTLTGSLVRVHWVEGGDTFGRQALAIAEKAVGDAARLLGVTESQPIDFYVYTDRQAFYDVLGPGARENVGAAAFPDIRSVFANITTTNPDDPIVGIYIPHELTHIVFGDATSNPYHEPLHWLNEGLAVYLSQGFDGGSRDDVATAVADHTLMPLTSLSGQFPTQGDRFALAYAESVSAVDFLVRHYGRDALVKLIRTYANGVGDDEAFQAGIGTDQAGFEAAWLDDVGAPAPSPFGPRPAPAGPVPPDWAAAGAPTVAPGGPAASGDAAPAGTPSGGLDWLVDAAALLVVLAVFLVALNVIDRRRRSSPDDNPHPW